MLLLGAPGLQIGTSLGGRVALWWGGEHRDCRYTEAIRPAGGACGGWARLGYAGCWLLAGVRGARIPRPGDSPTLFSPHRMSGEYTNSVSICEYLTPLREHL